MIFDRRARIFLAITALLMASAIAFWSFWSSWIKKYFNSRDVESISYRR